MRCKNRSQNESALRYLNSGTHLGVLVPRSSRKKSRTYQTQPVMDVPKVEVVPITQTLGFLMIVSVMIRREGGEEEATV